MHDALAKLWIQNLHFKIDKKPQTPDINGTLNFIYSLQAQYPFF